MLIRLGTRASKLALKQTDIVARALAENGVDTTIVQIETHGDSVKDEALFSMSNRGVFVSSLNEAILEGRIDAAVHSAKDLPAMLPESLEISGVMEREDPHDVLVSNFTLADLPAGSVIGSSSLRRAAMLGQVRSDLELKNIRGNIDTRIRKLESGEYDAIIIAEAGLKRLGLNPRRELLDLDRFVPAPSQGIIAVVTGKTGNAHDILEKISHKKTSMELNCERNLMRSLELGCSSPSGIYCSLESDGKLSIRISLYSKTGKEHIELVERITEPSEALDLGTRLKKTIPESFGYYR
ncbi:MAG: hydroxymethylbilane synthase [Candidatus Thermoplasmatota archaeon]|nr:hydroxymethylbilane synthase [Candidatus Thermoplasmatota archaeon]